MSGSRRFAYGLAALAMLLVAAQPAQANPVRPAGAVTGSIGIRLLDPSACSGSSSYLVATLRVGRGLSCALQVSNSSPVTQHVSLYPAAAQLDPGGFRFSEGHSPNELSSWTALSASTLDLPAQHSATVRARISVPADASSGRRYAVVWAEVTSAAGPGQLAEANRVGVRIYLDVMGGSPAPVVAGRLSQPAVPTADPAPRPTGVATDPVRHSTILTSVGYAVLAMAVAGLVCYLAVWRNRRKPERRKPERRRSGRRRSGRRRSGRRRSGRRRSGRHLPAARNQTDSSLTVR